MFVMYKVSKIFNDSCFYKAVKVVKKTKLKVVRFIETEYGENYTRTESKKCAQHEYFGTEQEAKDCVNDLNQRRYNDLIKKALMIKLESNQVVSNDGHLLLTVEQVENLACLVRDIRFKNSFLQNHGSVNNLQQHIVISKLLDEVATVLGGD